MKTATHQSLRSLFLEHFDGRKDGPVGAFVAEALRSEGAPKGYDRSLFEALDVIGDEEITPFESIDIMGRQAAIDLLWRAKGSHSPINWPEGNRLHHWKEFQISEALLALNKLLRGKKGSPPVPRQFEGGATPLEFGGRWQWAGLPHQRYHSYLGVLWCLLAVLTENESLIDAASQVAFWQLNALDKDFKPFIGFLTQEEDADIGEILAWNALLFAAVGSLKKKHEAAYAAQKQLSLLDGIVREGKGRVPLLAVSAELFLEKHVKDRHVEPFVLGGSIYDRETALVGCREKDVSVVCTVYGGRTGLGALVYQDLEIVTYGPQYRPYGDCKGFGIQATPNSQKKFPNLDISQSDGGFTIKGTAKLPGKVVHASPYALFRNTSHSETWIDIIQSYQKGTLRIEALLLGLDDFESLSFTFYIKGRQCLVNEKEVINSRSLDRFKGDVALLDILGSKGKIRIEPCYGHGVMEVIPLAGDRSFWGADFLIGYTVNKKYPKYVWEVRPLMLL